MQLPPMQALTCHKQAMPVPIAREISSRAPWAKQMRDFTCTLFLHFCRKALCAAQLYLCGLHLRTGMHCVARRLADGAFYLLAL